MSIIKNKKKIIIVASILIILILYDFHNTVLRTHVVENIKLVKLTSDFSDSITWRNNADLESHIKFYKKFQNSGENLSFVPLVDIRTPQINYAIYRYGLSMIFIEPGIDNLEKYSIEKRAELTYQMIKRMMTSIDNEISLTEYLNLITKDSIYKWKYYPNYNTIIIGMTGYENFLEKNIKLIHPISDKFEYGDLHKFLSKKIITSNFKLRIYSNFEYSENICELKEADTFIELLLSISSDLKSSTIFLHHDYLNANEYGLSISMCDNIRRYLKLGYWDHTLPKSAKKKLDLYDIILRPRENTVEENVGLKISNNFGNKLYNIKNNFYYEFFNIYDKITNY